MGISSYSRESLEIVKTGTLKITEDSFIINQNERIYYHQIKHIELSNHDYQGRQLSTNGLITGNFSSGTRNSIEIITIEDKKIKKKLHLTSERQMHALSVFLSEFIINNSFINISNIKQLTNILPEDFRKNDRSRKYIAQLIKTGKLNQPEGLLIMNYSSYEEAQDLKKQYL
ncbi:hypothetical protein ACOSP6_09155 [Tenacibaculum sp. MEBiC06402]|uniref:hypothetical protein n=1 Tax=unclassified Tenacibaculum TaxID=2635139 RepID=UPI003B99FEAD